MTLDEAIKRVEKVAEENQRIVDTGILFDNVTIDMFYDDDTGIIEEELANYQKCAERHKQFAEWLKELKQLRDQSRWIPVSERLPEIHQDVILSLRSLEVEVGFKAEAEPYFYHHGYIDPQNVLAWMPLPTPYVLQESEV